MRLALTLIFALSISTGSFGAERIASIDVAPTSKTADAPAPPAAQVIANGPAKTSSPRQSKYKVTLMSLRPLRLDVTADISIDGDVLQMDSTHPAELPEMAATGWPTLITSLSVHDAEGKELSVAATGSKGWQLDKPMKTTLRLRYTVDFSVFAKSGWTSALESAFVDDMNAMVVGRSLFITTAAIGEVNVAFETPKGWRPVVPWRSNPLSPGEFQVSSTQDLTNNMVVFSRNNFDTVKAAGFEVRIVSMGHWRSLRPHVRHVIGTIISREVALMQYPASEIYSVVLLPIPDVGGNAYRQGFVYCHQAPNRKNTADWGNTLAHEIFHYWNYARLKGANYAASQWFQEGFTEYVANLVMINGRLIDQKRFVGKLSEHVNNARQLTTSLENYGTKKGPPLYSAGALVAFIWDVRIRHASDGKRNIGDFFRNLMAQTDGGQRRYSWVDIRAALAMTADGDWEVFYQSHIKGKEPIPLAETFSLVGLRLERAADGSERLDYDFHSTPRPRALWEALTTG